MMRVAWFSPLSFADAPRCTAFTREIIGATREKISYVLFVDDKVWETHADGFLGCEVHPYHRAFIEQELCPFDIAVHQVENSPCCEFIRRTVALLPGVVVVHDLYPELFATLAGSAEGTLALSPGVCFCADTERSLNELEAHGLGPQAFLSFPVTVPTLGEQKRRRSVLRHQVGLENHDLVIAYAGRFALEDREFLLLEALPEIAAATEGSVHLLWLVNNRDDENAAAKVVAGYSRSNAALSSTVRIIRVENEEHLQHALSLADLFLAVKFDALRGYPLALLQALALGIPTVVSHFGPSAELPEGAVFPLPLGVGEGAQLANAVTRLLNDRALREQLSEGARNFALQYLDTQLVTVDFLALLERWSGRSQEAVAKRELEVSQAKRDLLDQLAHGVSSLWKGAQ